MSALAGLTFTLHDHTHEYVDQTERKELILGFVRVSHLFEADGVWSKPLQEKLRSKFGVGNNESVTYKMQLDGDTYAHATRAVHEARRMHALPTALLCPPRALGPTSCRAPAAAPSRPPHPAS